MEASAVKVKHPDLNARELSMEMRTATELSVALRRHTQLFDAAPDLDRHNARVRRHRDLRSGFTTCF